MTDRWQMMVRAEAIAGQKFGVTFYELPEDQQRAVFQLAMDDWREAQLARADEFNDARK
jgi:hypothetical protein